MVDLSGPGAVVISKPSGRVGALIHAASREPALPSKQNAASANLRCRLRVILDYDRCWGVLIDLRLPPVCLPVEPARCECNVPRARVLAMQPGTDAIGIGISETRHPLLFQIHWVLDPPSVCCAPARGIALGDALELCAWYTTRFEGVRLDSFICPHNFRKFGVNMLKVLLIIDTSAFCKGGG